MPVVTQIQFRRGTAAQWTSTNPTLAAGEVGYETDTGYMKVGNGSTAWTSLAYQNALAPLSFNSQTGTSYTLALTDAGRQVELSNTAAITVTVPTNASVALPIGAQIALLQTNTGQVTVAGAGGVTVNGNPGLKLRAQWSYATLIQRAANTWVLVGDTTA